MEIHSYSRKNTKQINENNNKAWFPLNGYSVRSEMLLFDL